MESWYKSQQPQTPLFLIQDQRFTREILQICKAAGISSLENIVERETTVICRATGLSVGLIKSMKEKAYSRLPPCYFLTALELHKERIQNIRIPTGSAGLDQLLGGQGIESGYVTEIIGDHGVGKSQICMTLSVTCQLVHTDDGNAPACIYLDTSKNFSTQRVISIARRFAMDPEKVLGKILYMSVKTSNLLLNAFKLICEELKTKTYYLIIVDSATELFRVECMGATINERNNLMSSVLLPLKSMAMEHRVAIVTTNHSYAVFDKWDAINKGPLMQPYGGHIMSSLSKTRINVRSTESGGCEKKIEMINSPELPYSSIVCKISNGGLEDIMSN